MEGLTHNGLHRTNVNRARQRRERILWSQSWPGLGEGHSRQASGQSLASMSYMWDKLSTAIFKTSIFEKKNLIRSRWDHEFQLTDLLLLFSCCLWYVSWESTSGFLQKKGTEPFSVLGRAGHSKDSLAPCPDTNSVLWAEGKGSVDRTLPFCSQAASRDCFWLEKWGPWLLAVTTEGLNSVVGTWGTRGSLLRGGKQGPRLWDGSRWRVKCSVSWQLLVQL